MGNVSARDNSEDEASQTRGMRLDSIIARVQKVHVEGLLRTKEDVVLPNLAAVFEARHFEGVLLAVQDVRSRLEGLGCFSDVEVHIDTCPGGGRHDYEVTFAVQELKRIVGSVNTMVGNQEGSLVVGLHMPNLIGRGEKFQMDYSHGTKQSNQFNANLSKPLRIQDFSPILTGSLFQQASESMPSAYKELSRGVLLELAFNSAPRISHKLQYEAGWRELSCLHRMAAFAVREHAGHSLKSSIKHILQADRRDDSIFPTEGSFFRLSQELAGLGGDVGFFKNELELQANLPIFLPSFLGSVGGGRPTWVLQSSFQCGLIHKPQLEGEPPVLTLLDRFYMGGPLNVRGFEMRGLGPSSEGHATGGRLYWATGLHLYAPLPFRSTSGGFGELFRTHAFVTAGNLLSDFYGPERPLQQGIEGILRHFRLSYGVGLALRLGGVARLELNYCVPLRVRSEDKVTSGLQLGVGVHFL